MFCKKSVDILILPSIQNLNEIMKDVDAKVTKAFYSQIEFKFVNGDISVLHKGRDINTFSAVWLSSFWATRDLATTVKMYLDSYDVPTTYVEQSTSKMTDCMSFALNGISVPNTYYIQDSKILDHLKDIEATCGYPMIMKDTKGFGGVNSAFITSRSELSSAIEMRNKSRKYMFQKYIQNDYDWGILVANGKIVSGEKSYPNKGEFLNNACAGATEVFVDVKDIPEDVKDMALQGALNLGLSWCRSDIIIENGTQNPYLLEVNRFPGITLGSNEVSAARNFINGYLQLNNLLPESIEATKGKALLNEVA